MGCFIEQQLIGSWNNWYFMFGFLKIKLFGKILLSVFYLQKCPFLNCYWWITRSSIINKFIWLKLDWYESWYSGSISDNWRAKSISNNHNKNQFDPMRQKIPQEKKTHTAFSECLDLCNFDTDGDILGSQNLSNNNIDRAHLLLQTSTFSSKPSL